MWMNVSIESGNSQKIVILFKDSSAIIPSEEALALGLEHFYKNALAWTTKRNLNLDLRSFHLLH
jgi:hypothetical protein